MAYHMYITDAIIVRGIDYSEGDSQKIIFTRDLGLLSARAQSIRKLASKLRFSLQDYHLSRVSLINGKAGWRIVSARFEESFFEYFRNDKSKLKALARVISLTEKITPYEEKNSEIFFALILFVEDLKIFNTEEEIKNIECVYALRTLHRLGYLLEDAQFFEFLENKPLEKDSLIRISNIREKAISVINMALKESHLY